jgi:WD40 repeat protein
MNLMWSPDSSRITCRDNAYDVHIWDATTGKPLMTHTHPMSNLQKESGWFAVWSPDSVYVAWTSYTSKQTRVWNVFTGNHIVDYSSSSQPAWSSDSSRIAFSSTDITVQVWKAPSS